MANCCDQYMALGCYNSCDNIVTPFISDYTGVAYLEYSGSTKTIVTIDVAEGEPIVIPGEIFNESATIKFQIKKPNGEYIQHEFENTLYECFQLETSIHTPIRSSTPVLPSSAVVKTFNGRTGGITFLCSDIPEDCKTTWENIVGDQSVINVGGFTNDVPYLISGDITASQGLNMVGNDVQIGGAIGTQANLSILPNDGLYLEKNGQTFDRALEIRRNANSAPVIPSTLAESLFRVSLAHTNTPSFSYSGSTLLCTAEYNYFGKNGGAANYRNYATLFSYNVIRNSHLNFYGIRQNFDSSTVSANVTNLFANLVTGAGAVSMISRVTNFGGFVLDFGTDGSDSDYQGSMSGLYGFYIKNYLGFEFKNYLEGQLGIGAENPHSSAKLEVNSTTQGILPPRMTEAQRDLIASPATGLTLYCTDATANDASTGVLQTWNGSVWKNSW